MEEVKKILTERKIFEDEKFNELLLLSILEPTLLHYEDILKYKNKNRYICTQNEEQKANDIWFAYSDHRWYEKSSKEMGLKLMCELSEYYIKIRENITNKKTRLKIKQMIMDLQKKSQRKNMGEYASVFLHEYNFEAKLNQNRHIICFENGVYDLERMIFREGKPEDYMTISVGYNYKPESRSEKLEEVITQILPEERVRNYVLKLFSNCLQGSSYSKFYCFNGENSNGKNVLLKLLQLTLGEYSKLLPVTVVTGKRKSTESPESPDNNLYSIKNKRLIIYSRPKKNNILNMSKVRELTGSESLSVRRSYNSPICFIPKSFHFLICNNLPRIREYEKDLVIERVKNIRFISSFVENPVRGNEYKKDVTIKEQMKDWRESFMNILLMNYKKLQEEDINDIPEIMISENDLKGN